jgi:hypothetical protein
VPHDRLTRQIKTAELLSSLGAGILGGGVFLLFADRLAPYAAYTVVIGIAAHSVGMYRKHQLEARSSINTAWWSAALYWGCWAALAGSIALLVARSI